MNRVLKLGVDCWEMTLEGEEQQKGHHQTEKSHGFRESETQDGVREKLLFQGWVTRVTDDQGAEDATDTGT